MSTSNNQSFLASRSVSYPPASYSWEPGSGVCTPTGHLSSARRSPYSPIESASYSRASPCSSDTYHPGSATIQYPTTDYFSQGRATHQTSTSLSPQQRHRVSSAKDCRSRSRSSTPTNSYQKQNADSDVICEREDSVIGAPAMSQTDANASSSMATDEDDWSAVTDPGERRKIQNRIAQRKFREKTRQQKEDADRQAENASRAAGAYAAPEPEEVDNAAEPGLPWGSISMRHVIVRGREREQSSRETSLYAAASRTGGSSRVGLHLVDEYARGSPAWAAWRNRVVWATAQTPPPPAMVLPSNDSPR